MSSPLDDIVNEVRAESVANGDLPPETKSDAEIIAPKKRRGRPPGSSNKPKEPAIDVTEEAVMAAWQGLFSIIAAILWLFGAKAKPSEKPELSEEEARSDAKQLMPIALKYPAIMSVLSWIGAPIVIVKRVRQKFDFSKKEKKIDRPIKDVEGIRVA